MPPRTKYPNYTQPSTLNVATQTSGAPGMNSYTKEVPQMSTGYVNPSSPRTGPMAPPTATLNQPAPQVAAPQTTGYVNPSPAVTPPSVSTPPPAATNNPAGRELRHYASGVYGQGPYSSTWLQPGQKLSRSNQTVGSSWWGDTGEAY